MKVIFKQCHCRTEFGCYGNGNTAILLKNRTDGQTVAVATTNTGTEVPPNIVAIKDWSENSGMTLTLITAGVIEPKRCRSEENGFVDVAFYPLTGAVLRELEKQKKGAI